MNAEWFKRRWLDFRTGHSTYLTFILAFSNTILIVYYFLIERITFLNDYIPNIGIFTLLFLGIYLPLAIIIGNWHVKTQLRTEAVTMWEERPYFARTFRLLLNMNLDRAKKEELESMRNFLKKIEENEI
jgi:hypothetical protein